MRNPCSDHDFKTGEQARAVPNVLFLLAYTNLGSGFLLGSPTQSHYNGSLKGSHIRFRGSLHPNVCLDDVLCAIPSCVLERL